MSGRVAPEPADRFASMDAFAAELRACGAAVLDPVRSPISTALVRFFTDDGEVTNESTKAFLTTYLDDQREAVSKMAVLAGVDEPAVSPTTM